MRVEELRIGNWVEDIVSYRFVKIDGIESNHDVIWVNYKNGSAQYDLNLLNLQPIKLTEEILLKCGFVFSHIIGDERVFSNKKINLLINAYDNNIIKFDVFIIKHLHQLQNLFFSLTHKELEINGL